MTGSDLGGIKAERPASRQPCLRMTGTPQSRQEFWRVKMDAPASRYRDVYARWQRDPQGFWGEAADAIDWIEKPKTVFDAKQGIYGRWFPDGVCNTCYNALDRHV